MDSEPQHKRRIGRTFAIAAKAVTVEQFRQFDNDYQIPARYTRTADLPAIWIDWYRGARYCNWLSKEEGISKDQWCYEIKGDDVELKANYLRLTGYRLPTEAEMELAARAGALTSRYYGETDELLPKYAWYSRNSRDQTWPVGSLKPNDLGLFDMQGNVWNWCQERGKDYPTGKGEEAAEDQEDEPAIAPTQHRVLRGCSFLNFAPLVRCAHRIFLAPPTRFVEIGFRPARTLRLDGFTDLHQPPKGGE
jgi:formylglycine-generating enzyme required for sulfatase activity